MEKARDSTNPEATITTPQPLGSEANFDLQFDWSQVDIQIEDADLVGRFINCMHIVIIEYAWFPHIKSLWNLFIFSLNTNLPLVNAMHLWSIL